jgi:glycosyltransferase involved in cell wall biosynthesis
LPGLDHILFTIYLLLGPGVWAALIALLVMGHHRMNRLRLGEPPPPVSSPAPLVTILIPAKDEAQRIEACVAASLGQDYPNFEIIAIDDRSTDGTGEILDRLAAGERRLTALHVAAGELPAGWAGKTNALHRATPTARGDWLLFLDSDVVVEPTLLKYLVGAASVRGYDAISLLTGIHGHSMLQETVLPAAAGVWGMMHLVSVTNNDNRKGYAVANGQVFLIRRSAYEAIGGHASARFELAEDVQLMRMLKTAGFRTRLFLGRSLATTHMYGTTRQAIRGWARIYATTNRLRSEAVVTAIAILGVSAMVFWPAAIFGVAEARGGAWHWLVAAGVHWGAMGAWLAIIYRASGNSRRYAIAAPLTFLFVLGILFYALVMCRTGRISWRGTQYAFRAAGGVKDGSTS